jgi:uncharacterized protein (TIGR02597 family)
MSFVPRTVYTAFATLLLAASTSFAQTATTDPVGFVTVSAVAGTGSARTTSVISYPLLNSEIIAGQAYGRITDVTANSIINSSAGWSVGELSVAANPYFIRITSGLAKGYTFLISTSTANTATAVTIDPEEAAQIDLSALGIVTGASGDTYAIYACDTLSGAFGTPATTGIQGGILSSGEGADVVQLFVSGFWRQYYYNTTLASWRRVGPNTISDNVPIRPDSAVLYSRLATSTLSLTVIGAVPTSDRKALVKKSGVSFLSNSWPVSLTLGTSGIQLIPGWASSATYDVNTTDIVQLMVNGFWVKYFYSGTNWKRVGPNTTSDSVSIAVGSAFIIEKKGSVAGSSTITQGVPY